MHRTVHEGYVCMKNVSSRHGMQLLASKERLYGAIYKTIFLSALVNDEI